MWQVDVPCNRAPHPHVCSIRHASAAASALRPLHNYFAAAPADATVACSSLALLSSPTAVDTELPLNPTNRVADAIPAFGASPPPAAGSADATATSAGAAEPGLETEVTLTMRTETAVVLVAFGSAGAAAAAGSAVASVAFACSAGSSGAGTTSDTVMAGAAATAGVSTAALPGASFLGWVGIANQARPKMVLGHGRLFVRSLHQGRVEVFGASPPKRL